MKNKITHINATPEFLADPDKMKLLETMCNNAAEMFRKKKEKICKKKK